MTMPLRFWVAAELNEASDRDAVERLPKILGAVVATVASMVAVGEIEFTKDEEQKLIRPLEHIFVEPDMNAQALPDGEQPTLVQVSVRLFRPEHYPPPVAQNGNPG
jgi:hypothetical protein